MTNQQLWQAVLGNLEVTLSKANFITWFRNTSVVEKGDDSIIVSVPNSFTKEWLQNKYNTDILKALRMVAPEVKEVKYQIISGSAVVAPKANQDTQNKVMPGARIIQNPSNNGLNPKYTFDTFIVGKGN